VNLVRHDAYSSMTPISVAALAGLPLGPWFLSIGSPSNWTFFPSILTFMDPGPTKRVGPSTLAETIPPPLPWLAPSPVEPKVALRRATFFPSIVTLLLESFFGADPLSPILGSGVGTSCERRNPLINSEIQRGRCYNFTEDLPEDASGGASEFEGT